MWFKNLYVFNLENPFELSATELHEELSNKRLQVCAPTQRQSVGWTKPLGNKTESLAHEVDGCILIRFGKQERILPASVVREELDERVSVIEDQEDRKVGGKEKKQIREEIEFEFLPRAFTRTTHMDAWIDTKTNTLFINTPTASRAEELTGLMRKTLGSFAVELPETELSPSALMTGWVVDGFASDDLNVGGNVELSNSSGDGAKALFKKYFLGSDEVSESIQQGGFATSLELEWKEKIQFTLTSDLNIKKLKFLDVMEEKMLNEDQQSHAERIDIEFALMTGEVREMWADLLLAMG